MKWCFSNRGGAVGDYLLIMTVVVGVSAPLVYKYFAEPLQASFSSQRENLVSFIAQDRKSLVQNTWFNESAPGGGDGVDELKEVGRLETGELEGAGELGRGSELTTGELDEVGDLETGNLKGAGQLDGPSEFRSSGGAGGAGGASSAISQGAASAGSDFGGGEKGFFGEKPGGKASDTLGSNPSGASFGEAQGGGGPGGSSGPGGSLATQKDQKGGGGAGKGEKEVAQASKREKGRMATRTEDGREVRAQEIDWWMILKLILVVLIIFFVVVIFFSSVKRTS